MGRKQTNTTKEKNNLLSRMESYFDRNEKTFLWISLSLGVIMSILMFDCKVSLSGDDCDYIINAQQFIRHFTYPGGRGALYPVVISPFMIGGLNLILLKALSAVFTVLSMWLMYKAFRGKIPAVILMPALLIANLCPYIFFYASYTYSEPFFMLTQSLFFYLFSKYFRNDGQPLKLKTDWYKFLYIGLCFLAMGLTRTIGFAVMGAVIVYFCFTKQWKNLIYSLSAAVVVYIVFNLIKSAVWPDVGSPYGIGSYLAKNYYNPEQGMEDIPGFIKRIIDNSHIFLSGYLYQFMGFHSPAYTVAKTYPLLTVFTYCLFAFFLSVVYKHNKILFFSGIYTGVMYFASFFLLHTFWAQDRMIIIYYPLTLMFLLSGLYYFVKHLKKINLKWLYPAFLLALLTGTAIHAKDKTGQNIPVLQQNLLGNDLYGLTPDWENFIEMSRWANRNLDKDAVIVSRKPSISYVYTGRNFMGIFNVPFETTEGIMQKYNSEKTNTVFIAIDLAKGMLANLESALQYVIFTQNEGKFTIDSKEIKSAGIYAFDKETLTKEFTDWLTSLDIHYTTDIEAFIKQYREADGRNYNIICPETLYNILKNNNARYLLLPKIRLYTPQNTGRYVNTIHQYATFINMKYPNSFNLIHTIGKEETCELVEFIPQVK
jgi:hypothetical protein